MIVEILMTEHPFIVQLVEHGICTTSKNCKALI